MDGSRSVQKEMRNADKILISKRKVSHIEGRDIARRILLKWILNG
jgi:hypothetical protein